MNKITASIIVLSLVMLSNPALACTAVFASNGETVLVGNNEDFSNVLTKVWIHPPEEGKFGRIYFGFAGLSNTPMGGMNEKGLFFDCYSTPYRKVKLSRNKPRYKENLYLKIMEKCESVDQALALFDKYNLDFMETHQAFMADRFGEWAIVEGDVILRGKGGFTVVTNFRQSNVLPQEATCPRFKIATRMIKSKPEASVEFVRRVMASAHIEAYPYMGNVIDTLYTNICDLTNGLVYLYCFHDYANEVVIDLKEEFKKGRSEYDLPALFPGSFTTNLYLINAEKRNAQKDLKEVLQKGVE